MAVASASAVGTELCSAMDLWPSKLASESGSSSARTSYTANATDLSDPCASSNSFESKRFHLPSHRSLSERKSSFFLVRSDGRVNLGLSSSSCRIGHLIINAVATKTEVRFLHQLPKPGQQRGQPDSDPLVPLPTNEKGNNIKKSNVAKIKVVVDLTAYVEKHKFCFDAVLDEMSLMTRTL